MPFFVTGLLLLTVLAQAAGLGFGVPYSSPSLTQANPKSTREIDSEVSFLLTQLTSSDAEKRRDAVLMLSRVEGAAVTAALLSALTDASPHVRAAAAAASAERNEAVAIPLLIACLTKDKDASVRKQAAYALGGLRGSDRTSALVTALKDKDEEVRGAAAVSLGDHVEPEALAPLTTALSDKNSFVRAEAARALGVNGNTAKSSVSPLIRLLIHDGDNEVKRQVATALGAIGDRSALPALEQAVRASDPYLVQASLDAIRMIEAKK